MTAISRAPARLMGREVELGVLFDLVDRVREDDLPRALVVRGEPGIGKTSLLTAGRHHASDRGVQVLSTAGAQAEADLPFSALHQLLMPMLDDLERLPERQREALGSAFGLVADAAPHRFLVGLAVLTLLSEKAEERPLLCTIDDAQWLDPQSAQTLAFVARRLSADSVVLAFAASEPSDELQGLPELMVEGLRDADACELLSSVVPGRLDERVRERILAETRGNPLALLELPKGLSPAQLAGGFGLPTAMSDADSLSGRIEESFLRRLEVLPADTQLLMLIAATEPVGDPALLWCAAEQLGIAFEALAPAVAAELLEVGMRVRFRHPLVRSAVYRAASPEERRKVHRALAYVTDPDVDPDRRAWHRGQAATASDEEVAAELEQSADRAEARGGFAAAAAFLERAAELTPEPGRRAERTLAAAQAKHQAGAPDAALALLAIAEAGPLDELQRARGERLRAQLAFALSRGDDAPPLLLSAARRLEPLDPAVARETYREALAAAITAGRRDTLLEVARAVPAGPPSQQPGADDLLLTGWTLLITEGYPAGTDLLRRALSALRSEFAGEDAIRELWEFASRTAILLWDDDTWHFLSARRVQLARDTGALTVLPVALAMHAESDVLAGELSSAAALLEESDAVTEATGSARVVESSMVLAGWRGREAQALELIEPALKEATEMDDDGMITIAEYATSVLSNGLGRYHAALGAAKRSCDHHPRKGFGFVLSEMVEAAARSGETELAAAALEQLFERTRLGDTDWALGVEARSRALLSENTAAEELFREAIERLSRTRVRAELARAHLLYGEWLRREGRRLDTREQLRIAHEMFTAMGMEAFAGRTERELLATGEKLRKPSETRDQLTPQEAQIARLARNGLTNAEIAAQLFLSPRTVEWHLHKVFRKLNISSRMGLHDALPDTEREVAPA
jgi:DNA-binding CsgD family transcriptional regulator